MGEGGLHTTDIVKKGFGLYSLVSNPVSPGGAPYCGLALGTSGASGVEAYNYISPFDPVAVEPPAGLAPATRFYFDEATGWLYTLGPNMRSRWGGRV